MIIAVGLSGCFSDSDSSTSSNQSDGSSASNFELVPGVYLGKNQDDDLLISLIDDDRRLWAISATENDDDDNNDNNDNLMDNFLGFTSSDGRVTTNNVEGEFTASGQEYPYSEWNSSATSFPITIDGNYAQSKVITGFTTEMPNNITEYSVKYNEVLSNQVQELANISTEYYGISYVTGDATMENYTNISTQSDGSFEGNYMNRSAGSDRFELCDIRGDFTVSESKRYFEVNASFFHDLMDTPCSITGQTFTGIALLGDDNELVLLSTDADNEKSFGFISYGDSEMPR